MRLFTAISWFFKILFRGNAAFLEAPAAAKPHFATSSEPAVQVLALLQQEGRLVDFLMEDLSGFGDAEIGAAARPIHEGCRRALAQYFVLERIASGSEGDALELAEGFDPSQFQLQGKITFPPLRGTLLHAGWRAAEVKLPTVPEGADPRVIAPAQVELR